MSRPRLEEEQGGLDAYRDAMAMRRENPRMPWEMIAARVGVTPGTLRRWRR